MGNVLNGLLLLVSGTALFIVAAMALAWMWPSTDEVNLVFYGLGYLGFACMIGGPVVYWIVVPIRNRRKSREPSW